MKFTLLIFFSVALLACTKEEPKQTNLVTFDLRGEVVAIDTAKMHITMDHEEIPDYMMAMTMPFKIKDRKLLEGLEVGDTVQGVLAVSRTESWLEALTVVGKGEPVDRHAIEGAILAKVLKTGDRLPNDPLTNQEGKRFRFSDYAGKAVAITFIYSRCPLPDFCILMNNNFAKLQKLLKADRTLDGKWHLFTISFDPEFDSPKVLKDLGTNYGADFSTWSFGVDSMSTIWKIAEGLGLTIADDEGGLIAHNLRTVVLNKEGRIAKIITGNDWTPEDVASEIKKIVR